MKKTIAVALLTITALTGCQDEKETHGVYLYGGTFMSSPLARVYGYADNWEGCQNLVKAHQAMFTSSQHLYFCDTEASQK